MTQPDPALATVTELRPEPDCETNAKWWGQVDRAVRAFERAGRIDWWSLVPESVRKQT